MDDELRYDGLGDENFFEQVGKWKPDGKAPVRKRAADAVRAIADLPTRGGRGARRKNKSMRRQ